VDRWYRRAAVVVWPRERTFAVRAAAAPAWAITTLRKRIRAGATAEVHELTDSLRPFWRAAVHHEKRRDFPGRVLAVAAGLDAPELALLLLQPFSVEALRPSDAPAFAAAVDRYGVTWTRGLLDGWSAQARVAWRGNRRTPPAGFAALPGLCAALATAAGPNPLAARLLLEDRWRFLQAEVAVACRQLHPSDRLRALEELAQPLLALLAAAGAARVDSVHDDVLAWLCGDPGDDLLPLLVALLYTADAAPPSGAEGDRSLDAVRRRAAELLQSRLAAPERAPDDWSIPAPARCGCELCRNLAGFLEARDRQSLEWPLAKDARAHVHSVIDQHDLPVKHVTRRRGRPYTLVLTKTTALFDREHAERRNWRAALARLG
jgi:hypothetical protein